MSAADEQTPEPAADETVAPGSSVAEPAGGEPEPDPAAAIARDPAAVAAVERARREARRAFRRRAWLVLGAVVLCVLALDQWSKHWAHTTLRFEHGGRLALVDGYLDLAYVRNPGAAWGFLARSHESFRQPFFVGISVVAMLFILYLFLRLEPGQRLLLVALSFVMGGAVGNFLDRLRFRFVIDFIELHFKHRHRWPTFNVADMAITFGVVLLFAEMLFGNAWRRARARRRSPEL